jgi:hypothetical protein
MNKTESAVCVCVCVLLFVREAGFPKPKAANKAQDMKRSNAPMDSLIIVNPELLLKIYNISDLKESLNVNNTQVVVEVKGTYEPDVIPSPLPVAHTSHTRKIVCACVCVCDVV